jgi:hypothetical protein
MRWHRNGDYSTARIILLGIVAKNDLVRSEGNTYVFGFNSGSDISEGSSTIENTRKLSPDDVSANEIPELQYNAQFSAWPLDVSDDLGVGLTVARVSPSFADNTINDPECVTTYKIPSSNGLCTTAFP